MSYVPAFAFAPPTRPPSVRAAEAMALLALALGIAGWVQDLATGFQEITGLLPLVSLPFVFAASRWRSDVALGILIACWVSPAWVVRRIG